MITPIINNNQQQQLQEPFKINKRQLVCTSRIVHAELSKWHGIIRTGIDTDYCTTQLNRTAK